MILLGIIFQTIRSLVIVVTIIIVLKCVSFNYLYVVLHFQ